MKFLLSLFAVAALSSQAFGDSSTYQTLAGTSCDAALKGAIAKEFKTPLKPKNQSRLVILDEVQRLVQISEVVYSGSTGSADGNGYYKTFTVICSTTDKNQNLLSTPLESLLVYHTEQGSGFYQGEVQLNDVTMQNWIN